MAEGWVISARVVVNDLLTDSAHCLQRNCDRAQTQVGESLWEARNLEC
jgi:hypothetical protein